MLTPVGVILRKESSPTSRIHAVLSLHRPAHLTPTDTLSIGLNGLLVQGSCPVPTGRGAAHSPVPGGGAPEWVVVKHAADAQTGNESHPSETDASHGQGQSQGQGQWKAHMEPVRFEISFDSKDVMNDWIDAVMERREALM